MKRVMRISSLAVAALLIACSGSHQSFDGEALSKQKTATILVAHPAEAIYPQVYHEHQRFAEIEFDDFQTAALGTDSVGYFPYRWVGFAAGYAAANVVSGGDSSRLLAGLSFAAAGAAIELLIVNEKMDKAEHKIAKHRQLVRARTVNDQFIQAARRSATRIESVEVTEIIDAQDLAMDEEEPRLADYMDQLETDYAIVVLYFPQFSPNFEVLEIRAVFGIYDLAQGADSKPLYSNFMLYQSADHAGRFPGETTKALEDYLSHAREKLIAAKTLNNKRSLSDLEKLEVHRDMHRREQARRKYYIDFDQRDPDGEIWLEDSGKAMHDAIENGIDDVFNMIVFEVNGQAKTETSVETQLSETLIKMQRVDQLSTESRSVYRDKYGRLISAEPTSRYIIH